MKKRGIRYNAEGDFCRIEFTSRKEAELTARLARDMITDVEKLKAMIRLAQKQDLD